MRILISGAGIAGLTLAHCCALSGHSCTLVERSPGVRGEGYMIDFFGSGYDAAERLDLLPELARIHYPIQRLAFLDARGDEKYSIPYPQFRELLDNRHFNFLRGDLEHLLYAKVKDHAEIRFSTTVESFEQDASLVSATLSDGHRLQADLLVGADGIHSRVRSLLFGEESRFLRFLGCNTAAFLLPHAPQNLTSADAFYTLTIPGHQAAVYPIRGGKLATFFVYRASSPLQHFDEQSATRELETAFSKMGWIVPQLFEQIEPGSLYFDQVAQSVVPQWSNGRVVLLGDAAYCVSLLAGQGASLALAGAYVLAEELQRVAGNGSLAAARYEQRMRPTVEEKQLAGRKFARWFVPSNSAMLFVRDLVARLSRYPLFAPLVRRSLSPGSVFDTAA